MLPYIVLFLYALIWLFLGLGYLTHYGIVKSYNNLLKSNANIYKAFSIACLSARQQLKEAIVDTINYYVFLNKRLLLTELDIGVTKNDIDNLASYLEDYYKRMYYQAQEYANTLSEDQCLAIAYDSLKETSFASLLSCLIDKASSSSSFYDLLTNKCKEPFDSILDNVGNALFVSNKCNLYDNNLYYGLSKLLVKYLQSIYVYNIACLDKVPGGDDYKYVLQQIEQGIYANYVNTLQRLNDKLQTYIGNAIITAFYMPILKEITITYDFNKVKEVYVKGNLTISLKNKNLFAKFICNLTQEVSLNPQPNIIYYCTTNNCNFFTPYGLVKCENKVNSIASYVEEDGLSFNLINLLGNKQLVLGNSLVETANSPISFYSKNNEVSMQLNIINRVTPPNPLEIYAEIGGKLGKLPILESNCNDNKDNDLDGFTDCQDSDCFSTIYCNPQYFFKFYSLNLHSFIGVDCKETSNEDGKLVVCQSPLYYFRVQFFFPLDTDYFELKWSYNSLLGLVAVFYNDRLVTFLWPRTKLPLNKLYLTFTDLSNNYIGWLTMFNKCHVNIQSVNIIQNYPPYFVTLTLDKSKENCCKQYTSECSLILGRISVSGSP